MEKNQIPPNTAGENGKQDGSKRAPLTKMTSGAEELRDHDFPVTDDQAGRSPGAVAVDLNAPSPEHARSGGEKGTIPGDKPQVGTVGAIMDQDGVDPDNFVDR